MEGFNTLLQTLTTSRDVAISQTTLNKQEADVTCFALGEGDVPEYPEALRYCRGPVQRIVVE